MATKKQTEKKTQSTGSLGRTLKIVAGILGAMLLISGLSAFFLYRHYVVNNPGAHIERDYILSRISRESPVYYRDGESKIGVFFGEEHRQYVTFDQLPEDYVNAIVASEDKRFWDHPGFDILGFTRAMLGNLKARKLIGGGSTITSQTAKNLYDRTDRTLKPKLLEVLNAFRLEAHYSKEEILEFYVNQFHVYGNGRGLGIAALYFFDKEVGELSTLECAFLAGVVKGPYQYNPFVGTSEAAREKARMWAEKRVDYVLGRMANLGYLSAEEASKLMAEDLPFKQGQFRFEHNVILDAVHDRLQGEPFTSIFAEAGIEDPARAGLQIITTVDSDYQRAAEYSLAHHLTELGTLLEGGTLENFIGEQRDPSRPVMPDSVLPQRFFTGRVSKVVLEGKGSPSLQVDIGGQEGTVDKTALLRVARNLKRAKDKNKWAEVRNKDATSMIKEVKEGQGVWVSVREIHEDGTVFLDLERKSRLQGAVVALDQGEVLAMVGGADNRNYNRVMTAKRQFGSTYKTLVYAAALTLGWSPLAPLHNEVQGFPFQNQPFYWPRPDHNPPAPFMTLAWSGASSENLAAVSLLYHMTDALSDNQVVDLAKRVGLAQKPQESNKDFKIRIRDSWGVIPNESSLREGLFEDVKTAIWPDLAFDGLMVGDGSALRAMPYGRGFPEERARLARNRNLSKKGKAARKRFLQRNFLDLETESLRATEFVRDVIAERKSLSNLYFFDDGHKKWLVYSELPGEEAWEPIVERQSLLTYLKGEQARLLPPVINTDEPEDSAYSSPSQGGQGSASRGGSLLRRFFDREPEATPIPSTPEPVAEVIEEEKALDVSTILPSILLVEGLVLPETLSRLREALEVQFESMKDLPTYDMARLIRDRDYRVLLSLNYVVQFAQEMGIRSEMKPVLSLALGANDTTLLEVAMMYQTFLHGRVYGFGNEEGTTSLLREIRDSDGSVLWKAEASWKQALEPWVGNSVGRILRGVVEHGTGRRAEGQALITAKGAEGEKQILDFGAAVPLLGKTGTTNSYVNAAFVGYVPKSPEKGSDLTYGPALTLASYVGYDDNTPMKRGQIRLAGSSGALPVWIDTAKGVVKAGNYSETVDLVDLAFEGQKVVPIKWPSDMRQVIVDSTTGLPIEGALAPGDGQSTYDVYFSDNATEPLTRYEPFHSTRRR